LNFEGNFPARAVEAVRIRLTQGDAQVVDAKEEKRDAPIENLTGHDPFDVRKSTASATTQHNPKTLPERV
jgi:hypothetical protein